jgi:UDP-N-acetylmuramyl pentapeptide synthase
MRSFVSSHRIVFFLGDMRELGTMTESLHEQLAENILDMIPHDADVYFFLV